MTDSTETMSLDEFESMNPSRRGKTGLSIWLRALPFAAPALIPEEILELMQAGRHAAAVASAVRTHARGGGIPGHFSTTTIRGRVWVCRYPEDES